MGRPGVARANQAATGEQGPIGNPLPRMIWLGGFNSSGTWQNLGPYPYAVAGQAIDEALRKSEPIWIWDPALGEWRRPM